MQLSENTSSHDLPEAIAHMEASTYKYSIPDHFASQPVQELQKEVVPMPISPDDTVKPQRWTRWPFLLLYALLIAVIAGVIGGIIGKSISKDARPDTTTPINDTNPRNSSSNDNSTRILTIPATGCPADIHDQKYMTNVSRRWKVDYTTVCATRWTDPQLTALSAATVSDCIEACQSYNSANPPNANTCLGASFVPRWWDQEQAMAQKNEPFNCFLMKNNTILNKNKREFEIVALCLKDACNGLIGG